MPDSGYFDTLHKEWPVIKAAPWSFFICVAIISLLVCLIIFLFSRGYIEHLKRRIEILAVPPLSADPLLKEQIEESVETGLFTPLQIKEIKLARELRALAEKGQQGCSESDVDLMRITYEHTFAPQVKALISEIELEGGGDSTLRRFADFALNGNDILSVANALIRLAFLQDGIDVTRRYPLL